MQPIIAINDLSKTYASGFQALKNINLEIGRGEVFGLLGVILGPLIVSFFLSIMRTIEKQGEAAVRLRSS